MIPIDTLKDAEEKLFAKLEASWPKTFNDILRKAKDKKFYVFTVLKKNFHVSPPEINIYHQIRKTRPDPVMGTVLRLIDKEKGTSELIWALPDVEAVNLFKEGKAYANEKVYSDIETYAREAIDTSQYYKI